MDVQQEFWRRLKGEWLPAYCNDPRRCYAIEGFKTDSKQVTDVDARDFLRALDHNVVLVDSGGRIRMPQSKTHEVIFWEHSTSISPRPITLWLEPIITIAAIARLHLDYGWPKECLGMQSQDLVFDLMAFRPDDLENEYIAGEVKGSASQLDGLLAHMSLCAVEGNSECSAPTTRKNAHRKIMGLKRCGAPIFWAIGPGGDSRVFKVEFDGSGLQLHSAFEECLRFVSRR